MFADFVLKKNLRPISSIRSIGVPLEVSGEDEVLMLEVARAGEDHGNAALIGGFDDLFVAD